MTTYSAFHLSMDDSQGSTRLCEQALRSLGQRSRERHVVEIRSDQQGLPEAEKHEADFYHVYYSGTALMQGRASTADNELDRFSRESKQFLSNAPDFSSREQQVASVSVLVLESFGRIDEARQFGRWILEQINERPEFSSNAAKTPSERLIKVVNRLEMMYEILDLKSRTVEDQSFDLKPRHGKVVLIEFWGTHCKPCIADFPALKRIYAAYKDRGFETVAITAILDNFRDD